MTMLFCPSKQKNIDLATTPVTRERDLSPERVNTCIQGLSSQLDTNISLFENLKFHTGDRHNLPHNETDI